MADTIKTAKAIRESGRENLRKVSISRIKKEMNDVFYLSDDLVITTLSAQNNTTAEYPASIDGFSAIIMMTGEATVSIDMQNYSVKPNTIVFFNPDSIIRTVKCSANAAAYFLAFSKSFVNEIQIDLSTSLPVYMRFGKAPVLEVAPQDVDLEKGDPVRVTEGIFAGIEGRYIRHKGHSKVAVAIKDIATALTAYVPLKYIEKINQQILLPTHTQSAQR